MASSEVTRRVAEARPSRKSWRQWVLAVSAELASLGYATEAERLQVCGVRCKLHSCRCGVRHILPLSHCGLRICPFCARRESRRFSEDLAAKIEVLSRRYARYRWRLVTLTCRWDPSDPEQLTVEGLRRRAKDLWRRWSSLWPELVRIGCVAAHVTLECSDGGHVHLHALVLGPWIDRGWIGEKWRDFVDVRVFRGVKEITKYITKVHCSHDAEWLGGRHRRVIHPRLAARWWAATRRAHLHRSYGELRGITVDSAADSATPTQPQTCGCGAPLPPVGDWDSRNTAELLGFLVRAGAKVRIWDRPPDQSTNLAQTNPA